MATFKSKMKYLQPDWADVVWDRISEMNGGQGAAWRLGAAAMAITGARPASLERGIRFNTETVGDEVFITGFVPGAKIIRKDDTKRGQDHVLFRWRLSHPAELPVRSKEYLAIVRALKERQDAGDESDLVVEYGADAIGSSMRMLSKTIWPRRKYHVSPICYREAFSEQAKGSGVDPRQIALAMGHLSAESQGKYSVLRGKARGRVSPKKLFTSVQGPQDVRMDRAPMARFKSRSASKRKMKLK